MNVYVPIKITENNDPFYAHSLFTLMIWWLRENVGENKEQWKWEYGDVHATGIWLPDEECATMFKLRFNV